MIDIGYIENFQKHVWESIPNKYNEYLEKLHYGNGSRKLSLNALKSVLMKFKEITMLQI